MGFGLIANAVAGGLAGGGQAAERGFARLGETQARMDLEQLRAQIETDRQAALARLNSELRRGDAKYASDLQLEVAGRERGAVRGIIDEATRGAADAGPVTPAMTRRAARDALASAGRLREAADYDKATEPPKITSTTTPLGSITTRTDEDGREVGRTDNNSGRLLDVRAAGRAPRPLDQAGLDRIHDQATKFGDRLAAERPHPFPDPTATGKDAAKDGAMVTLARTYMTRALTRAAQSGELVAPADLENLFRAAVDKADERVIAAAEKEAATYFDDKGRPRTGSDQAMKAWGIRGVVDRDSFLRAYRDKYLGTEMRAVLAEGAGRGAQPAADGERPDDPARLARRPTGLIGGAAGNPMTHDGLPARRNADGSYSTELSITVTDPRLNGGRPTNIPSLWGGREVDEDTAVKKALDSGKQYPAFANVQEAVEAARARSEAGGAGPLVSTINDAGVAIVEREQREMEAGKRRDFSPEAKAVIARMDAERQRGNDAMKSRMQQQDIERSRAAARAARGG